MVIINNMNMNDSMMVVTQPTEDDDVEAAGDDEVIIKSQKPKTSSQPTKANNNKDEKEEKERGKRPVDTLPDMTGKIITVSAEETLQLTKERKGSRASRKRPTDKKDNNNASALSSAQPQDMKNNTMHTSSEDIEKEFQGFIAKLSLTKSGEESISSDAVADTTNRLYKPIKSSSVLSSSDNRTGTSGGERIDSSDRDYINDGETNQACIMQRQKSEFLSEYTVETEEEGLPPQSAITSASNRRGSDTLTGGHTNTIDENESIDSWSKTDEQTSTRNKSETTLIDSSGDLADYNNNNNTAGDAKDAAVENSTTPSNNNNRRLPSRSNRTSNNGFHHRSSLRSSSNWERERRGESTTDNNNNDGGARPGLNRGISWASLISMESKKKQEEKMKQLNSSNSSDISPSHSRSRRRGRDRGDLNSSLISNSTPDSSRLSKRSGRSSNTRTSYSSHKSYSSRKSSDNHSRKSSDSKHSKRSTGSRGGRSVSWKNESTMTIINSALNSNDNDGISSTAKDPKYIRKQAHEKFERGLHYAAIGKYTTSRERFLMALRYRVMHYGPMHYNVAAVHEMLGNINYCLSEEVEEDEFEASLLRSSGSSRKDGYGRKRRGSIDERGGDDDEEGLTESMLGWDVTILENEKSTNTRSRVYLEKAAMHYRTVLDILGSKKKDKSKSSCSSKQEPSLDGGESTAKRSATNSLQSSTSGRGGVKFGNETTFNWSEIADTYNEIDDNDDSDDDDDDASLIEVIVTRVQERLSSMPAAVKGSKKSYLSGVLGS